MSARTPSASASTACWPSSATPNELVAAAQQTRAAGYRQFDCYTPFPIEELAEALGQHHEPAAAAGADRRHPRRRRRLRALRTGPRSIDYPLNVGGRPFNSWPSFIPITFESTVLVAALTAVLGMLALNGLPMPYHPVFNVPRFALASRDASSSASRRPIRSSTSTRPGASSRACSPRQVSQVEQ